ncbi:cupin domain-containing protein [Pseudodesulfovibrio senegalensis]|uniref:Cupin domain-containing protein n=2 Tax=Pseudodesulfovibrio senegalensis TaxID=1721087 RepID=A0A6N6MZN1_9BACT|nr:cupin domain-containing protein [Pseudodesulfovibrio senegalensis]KAB1439039.1 cupin domain-containing protein [Pseudodesulfovibrio senegalensis]
MMQDKIGKRIRTFREKQDLTLEAMAERTGLGIDFLKAVEEEGMYPSLGPLLKIARALGVRLGTFLDDQVSRDPLVVRLDERQEELTMHGGDHAAAFRYFPLGQGKSDRHMEPFFIEILPESGKDKSLSSHEGEEFILVKSGQLSVTYGREETILEAGDSIYYNSIVPHNVSAAGDEKCEIYAVLYFPE